LKAAKLELRVLSLRQKRGLRDPKISVHSTSKQQKIYVFVPKGVDLGVAAESLLWNGAMFPIVEIVQFSPKTN